MPKLFNWPCTGLTCLLLLLVSACSQQPVLESVSFASQQSKLAAIESWQLRGKVAVNYAGKSRSAYLNWQQQQQAFSIRLQGPFGAGATHLFGDPSQVTLERTGTDSRTAEQPRDLLREALGLEAPIDQLHLWIKGIPAPGPLRKLQLNEESATIDSFEQSGWRVVYNAYQYLEALPLPRKITITPAGQSGKAPTRLTLLVSHWQLDSADD